ncbi:hypothetical protein Peur_012795 [Populus x canadensis]
MQRLYFFFGVTVKKMTDKSLYSGVKSYLAFIFHICRGLMFVFSRWPVLVGFISRGRRGRGLDCDVPSTDFNFSLGK